ncbi:MAG TPA: glycosyltransferase [Streptosporangiaceae bacterium]|nr:glycosyltransferase [Streptosporangiaceae bacterium]
MRWPSVGVVVPTRNRQEALRAAVAAILTQDYPGEISVAVVFDQAVPDAAIAGDDRVRVLVNDRSPGLAGARNRGILALDTELVAFCDDDDEWLPGKLVSQVRALLASPGAEFASCGIAVRSGRRTNDRTVGCGEVTYTQLLRSRMAMVHSSTYLVARSSLLDGIGLVDESIPGSQNEDWDLALRAARRRPIVNVDRPLVRVTWDAGSYYSQAWETKVAGLVWMLARHPDIAATGPGAARVYAQIAFGYACMGRRRASCRWAVRAMRRNWRERRLPFVIAVVAGAVSGERVLRTLYSHGHGI